MILALAAAILLCLCLLACARGPLLGFYVSLVRRQEVPPPPDETILTYPLA